MFFFREKPFKKKRFGSQAPGFETRAARCKLRISKGKHISELKKQKNRLRRAIWYFLTGNLLNIMITIHP